MFPGFCLGFSFSNHGIGIFLNFLERYTTITKDSLPFSFGRTKVIVFSETGWRYPSQRIEQRISFMFYYQRCLKIKKKTSENIHEKRYVFKNRKYACPFWLTLSVIVQKNKLKMYKAINYFNVLKKIWISRQNYDSSRHRHERRQGAVKRIRGGK